MAMNDDDPFMVWALFFAALLAFVFVVSVLVEVFL